MQTSPVPGTRASLGFTLIELLVAMVVAALLISIALPTYLAQVRKSRRTEAKTAVLDLAGREERYFSVANTYSTTPSDLGYAASSSVNFPVNVGNNYYQITVATTTPAAPALPTFTVTATAISTDQLKDTACRTFSVTQAGVQSATDSASADNTAVCWR